MMQIDIERIAEILNKDEEGFGGISMGVFEADGKDIVGAVFVRPEHVPALKEFAAQLIEKHKTRSVCKNCDGTGLDFNPADFSSKSCKRCDGTGENKK